MSNHKFTYKDPQTLEKYMSDQGTILPRAKTGLSKKEQRRLSQEIERARHLSLLKYTQTL
jgi:small subunit ribosomal protein S18